MTLQMMGAEPKFMQTALSLEDALRRLGVRVQLERDKWGHDEAASDLSGEDFAHEDRGVPLRAHADQIDRQANRFFDPGKVRPRRGR